MRSVRRREASADRIGGGVRGGEGGKGEMARLDATPGLVDRRGGILKRYRGKKKECEGKKEVGDYRSGCVRDPVRDLFFRNCFVSDGLSNEKNSYMYNLTP